MWRQLRRKRLSRFAVVAAWLATLAAAGAHRVDEYLQAALLSVGTERVDLEIDLTPGVAMASEVFAWIDTNRDGEISSGEGQAYARQMLSSVELSVDGLSAPITLVETRFPEFRDMSLGVGTIRLRATAKVSAAGAGHHRLSFLNTHRSESSVYLVNALVPANPGIQGLTLDYTVTAETPSAWTLGVLAGLVLAGRWCLRGRLALMRLAQ
jgi:hypothetical protein